MIWRMRRTCIVVLATCSLAVLVHAETQNAQKAPSNSEGFQNSLGMHFARIPGFELLFSIWETRVADFSTFMQSSGHTSTGDVYSLDPVDGQWKVHPTNSWISPGFEQTPENPVVNVSWNDAIAFCQWLTARERALGVIRSDQEYRLPTDAEWSAAAGGTVFPWGETWPPPAGAGNYFGMEQNNPKRPITAGYDDGAIFTSPVGSYRPNAFGIYDLGGNVWEWCSDFYQKEMNSPELRREFPFLEMDEGGRQLHVLRGAGWVESAPKRLTHNFRSFGRPTNRYCVGFRVVLATALPSSP